MVEECGENIDKTKLTGMVLFEHVNEGACSYIVFVVLAVKALTVSIGIGGCFTYKYSNLNKENVFRYDYVYQAANYLV